MEQIERKLIPSLREGVDVIRMIFFKRLKEYLVSKYGQESPPFHGMLAGAIMNELFGTSNPDEKFVLFARENQDRIQEELKLVASEFEDLRILLTDGLRIHFLCNHQEELVEEKENEELLARAREYGILIEERDVPLPKGFMELVYRVGKSYGLVVFQENVPVAT
ncbi:MAG: hypothetical protein U9R66_05350 [Thermodesulfobacteriota bacterium]|nr:hypothetical protein [Thermodesulfobacteriota bacterium]